MTLTKSYADKFEKNILQRFFSGNSMDYHRVFKIIFPVLVDQFLITCLSLINTSMISSAGMTSISAVAMVDSLNAFLVNLFIAISIGGTVVVSQYKGNDNKALEAKAALNSIVTVFAISLFIAVIIIIFHTPILNFLFGKADPEVFRLAKIYIIGSAISYIGIAVSESVCGALRGIGETKSSLIISVSIEVLYVFLNFIFINIMHIGVLGMSISIIIARYFGGIFALIYLKKHNDFLDFSLEGSFKLAFSMIKKISYIGIPFAAEQLFFNGGRILTQTFIVSLGTDAISINAITSSIGGFLQIPASALSIAIVTIVGQSIGRNDIKDARKFTKSIIALGSLGFILNAVLLLIFFNPLISLFNAPQRLIGSIFNILLCCALFQIPFWSISFVLPSGLRAAGDSKFSSITSMITMWTIRVVLGYILGIVLKMNVFGIWLAMEIEWIVRALIFSIRFKGKKWYAHKLID